MNKNRRVRELFPPWNMPSDPVKALLWFMHWLLKVLVRFFWLPILGMVIFEAVMNGKGYGFVDSLVVGVITLLVGLVVWAVLWGLLVVINIYSGVSQVLSDVNRFQQQTLYQRSHTAFTDREAEKNVVEGTITDLQEERNKRRHE